MKIDLNRRRLLRGMAITVPGVLLGTVPTRSIASVSEKRSLTFFHTHTSDKLSIDYFAGNQYLPGAMHKINYFLRDFRTGDQHPIDPSLLDILFHVKKLSGSRGVFQVISGYRSPATNAQLRNQSNGVAKRSLHMQGKAIDIRLTDVDTAVVKKVAINLKQGGVGYYRSSNFVHLDTGRFRTW